MHWSLVVSAQCRKSLWRRYGCVREYSEVPLTIWYTDHLERQVEGLSGFSTAGAFFSEVLRAGRKEAQTQ